MLNPGTVLSHALEIKPRLVAGALLVVAVLFAVSFVGFTSMFSGSFWYDDEGYVMISVRSFLEGHPLYSEVYTQYGPFFFLERQVLHLLFGLPVTHDVNRFIALAEWLLTAALSGLLIYRLTRSRSLGFFGGVLAFLFLEVVIKEPGHPQQLCAICTVLSVVVATFFRDGRSAIVTAVIMGVIAGALLMTKINVGVYVSLAVLLSLALTVATRRRVLAWPLVAALVSLPTVLMFSSLSFFSNCVYDAAATLSIASVALVALERARPAPTRWRDLVAFLATVPVCVLATGALVAAQGAPWEGVVDGVWTRPRAFMKLAENIQIPFPLPSLGAAVVGFSLSVYFIRKRHKLDVRRDWSRKLAWTRLLFSLSVVAITFSDFILNSHEPLRNGTSLRGNAVVLLGYCTPFLWLLLACDGPEPRRQERYLGRVLLGVTASLQIMLPYPMFGSQVNLGTLPTLLLALVCLSDASRTLSVSTAVQSLRARWSGAFVAALWFPLLLALALKAHYYGDVYSENKPLLLSGATRLRLEPRKAEAFQVLSAIVRDHADTFYTILGTNSLYFWTEKRPPTHFNATAWPVLLTEEEQLATAEALSRFENAAVIEDARHNFFARGPSSPPMGPLCRYLYENFTPVGSVAHYRVYFRRGHELPRIELPVGGATAAGSNPDHGQP